MTETTDCPGHNAVTARAALPEQAAVRIAVRVTAVAIEMSHDAAMVLSRRTERRKEAGELICSAVRTPAEGGERRMIHRGRSLARLVRALLVV